MQDPNIQLTILSKMAHKPEVKFEKLYQKLSEAKKAKGKLESRILGNL